MLLHSDGRIRGDFQGAWDNPTGDTFAGLIPDEQFNRPRQICIRNVARQGHGGDLQRLWRVDACADSLIYPVLFPYGTLGWTPELEHDAHRATNLQAQRDASAAVRIEQHHDRVAAGLSDRPSYARLRHSISLIRRTAAQRDNIAAPVPLMGAYCTGGEAYRAAKVRAMQLGDDERCRRRPW